MTCEQHSPLRTPCGRKRTRKRKENQRQEKNLRVHDRQPEDPTKRSRKKRERDQNIEVKDPVKEREIKGWEGNFENKTESAIL